MSEQPKSIRALRDRGVLEVVWSDGRIHQIPLWTLRCECPCAGCVDEFTGERILNVEAIPDDVAPTSIEFSGNYALKIKWSDGHATGLYTWRRLAQIGESLQQDGAGGAR
jgi:DUF971 family protein